MGLMDLVDWVRKTMEDFSLQNTNYAFRKCSHECEQGIYCKMVTKSDPDPMISFRAQLNLN